MATATATATIDAYPGGIDNSQRVIYVSGVISVSASPATYASGGLTITWLGVSQGPGTGSSGLFPLIQGVDAAPFMVWLASAATSGTTVGGYVYVWNKANNSLQLLASAGTQTAGTGTISEEMTAGTAIPAAVSSDVIRFEAIFVRNFS